MQRRGLGMVAAILAGLVAGNNTRLAIAFVAGFIAEGLLSFVPLATRRALLFELATQSDAYEIPEVRRYGLSLITPARRLAAARQVAFVLRESSRRDAIAAVDRVAAKALSLTAIAQALIETPTVIEPTAMARLLRLLTDGSQSPLLNPKLAAERLDAELRLIEIGIRPASGPSLDKPPRASGHAA